MAGYVRVYQYLVVLRLHNKQTHRCRRALGVDRGSALRHQKIEHQHKSNFKDRADPHSRA